jgi:NADPH:quinone reductase
MPTEMRVIEITRPGAPEVLQLATRPVPQPGAGEVLIRVAAAGVNRPDVLQRLGAYPPPKGASDLPGLEVAGEIVSAAPDVDLWKVGDRVCALVPGGGYAEFVTTPAVQCLPVPASMPLETAAALPETFFTVYLNVFERAGLTAGETLLVHGGSSGIGTTAILLGKAFGATVIVTAGSASKCAACLELGADHAINYRETDFVPAVLAVTSGKGADVILDMVGGDYLARNIAAAAVEGRITQIATLGGAKAELNLRDLMGKRLRIMGSTLRPQPVAVKGRIAQALRTRVWPLFESGRLSPPPIYARFPLAEAHRAHALMESGEHVGKIVLMR